MPAVHDREYVEGEPILKQKQPSSRSKQRSRKQLRVRLIEAMSGTNGNVPTKAVIRELHREQRMERSAYEQRVVSRHGTELIQFFADGGEVNPAAIRPKLVLIERPDSIEGRLFRVATLLWSVPVSRGYGRRLRYLVIDESNQKLIGLIALGDPVFNLACRDAWIGWNVRQREERLSFVMDAYVLGAVPPYSSLLGGKLVGALVASKEIQETFRKRYGAKAGIISERTKSPRLVLVTTTSALGRSSIYNRLRLPDLVDYTRIGLTGGWGHFRVSDELFREVRDVLKQEGSSYYDNYQYHQGPNWRLRAIRHVADLLGIDGDLLRHGIKREVYGVPVSSNWHEVLNGKSARPRRATASTTEIAEAAINRWIVPRAERSPDWAQWTRKQTWELMGNSGLTLPALQAALNV